MIDADVGTGRQPARGRASRRADVPFHSIPISHPHTSRLSSNAVLTGGGTTATTYEVERLHLCAPLRVGWLHAVMCRYCLSAHCLSGRSSHSAPGVTIPFHSIPPSIPFHATSARFRSDVHLDEGTVELHDGVSDVPACRSSSLRTPTRFVHHHSIPFHFHSSSIPFQLPPHLS